MNICSQWIEGILQQRLQAPMRISVYCRSLHSGAPFCYDERVMPSASLIKIPIMIRAFRLAQAHSLDVSQPCPVYGQVAGGSVYNLPKGTVLTVHDLIFHMIVESDNTCTNMLIDMLGMDSINEEIRQQELRNTVLQRKMMDFAAAQAGRENLTSPSDMGQLLYRLAHGQCLGEELDRGMMDILLQQEDNCILPAQIPHIVPVAHKTGELDGLYHDCGIVWKKGTPYICCLMADGIDDEPQAVYDMSYIARDIYDMM
ncbi:serine hydrolase [uncultured Megasphaera sp.]|uniref:serine hydrolase n=1 Tax=uncultured Megasphaera sp. TaxID=165188 RepID=UPI002657F13F|nr:serine hydrolase [uncultured Megasphaera sp.]